MKLEVIFLSLVNWDSWFIVKRKCIIMYELLVMILKKKMVFLFSTVLVMSLENEVLNTC